ncbi:F-actin-monooxygenase mical1 isoform X1 [Latimeria chalumnae]|uniref:F-actin-monooxygenase mical1 isoform X1 n=1 Tax=Latimeria chalumnae TaxID=7897 RepID=UPI00313D7830
MNNPGAEQRDEAHVLFDNFVQAKKCKEALQGFQELCRHLELDPQDYRNFYQKLKSKLNYWKAKALWTKLDKRAGHADYNNGETCSKTKCLVVGAGPCGLRTAIELAFLGARVIVIEKRDTFSRNNVLHLWPFTIHDLRALGAKKFYGKFCSGSLDHISIRQLQLILLKAALILGIEVQLNVEFRGLLDPPRTQGAGNKDQQKGWRASLQPSVHPVGRYEFNVLISAGGSRLVPEGFKKKELRGKLAIGITANFVNGHTAEEARVAEISGVARIYHQKFFHNLHNETGIDLENIVYYKDDTHYFVMTAKKKSLLKKGVILQDQQDIEKLLSKKNVDFNALLCYAREAANFCTEKKLPKLEFAVNHRNRPDVDMFDFTCMHRSEDAALVRERNGHALLIGLVGDCLVEPFWPLGTGVARGFLAAFDAAWMVRKWVMKTPPLEILAERESIYQLLSQTSPDNTSKNYNQYSIDPVTRYPNINLKAIKPNQVHHLYDVEDSMKTSKEAEKQKPAKKFSRSDSVGPCEELLSWCQRHTEGYRNVKVKDLTSSWKSGLALCALINKFRPDLIDFDSLDKADTEGNNQKAFTVAEKELGISMIMTGQDMANVTEPDKLSMVMYLTQFYEAFKDAEPPNESADPVNKTKTISNVTKSAIFFLNQLKKNATLKRLAKEKTDPEEEMVKKPRKKDSSVNDQKVPLDSPLAPSDVCYFCSTRVYVLERGSAEGKFFHRSCFACHHCGTSLHLGSYVFNDKDGNFNCTQHYLYQFSAHQETEDQKPNTTVKSQNSKSPEEEEDEEGDSLDTTSRSWPAGGFVNNVPYLEHSMETDVSSDRPAVHEEHLEADVSLSSYTVLQPTEDRALLSLNLETFLTSPRPFVFHDGGYGCEYEDAAHYAAGCSSLTSVPTPILPDCSAVISPSPEGTHQLITHLCPPSSTSDSPCLPTPLSSQGSLATTNTFTLGDQKCITSPNVAAEETLSEHRFRSRVSINDQKSAAASEELEIIGDKDENSTCLGEEGQFGKNSVLEPLEGSNSILNSITPPYISCSETGFTGVLSGSESTSKGVSWMGTEGPKEEQKATGIKNLCTKEGIKYRGRFQNLPTSAPVDSSRPISLEEEKTEVRMPDSSSLVEQVEKGLLEKCGMKLNVGKAECYNKEQSTLTANLPSESSDLTSSTPGSLVPSALNPAEEPGQQIAKSDSEMKISMRRLYLSTLEKKKLCRLSLGSDSDSENPGDTVTDSRSFITSSLSDHLNLPGASRGCKTDNLNFRKKEDPRPCSARAQACWEEPGFLIEDFSQSDEESDDLSEEDDDWTFEEYAAKLPSVNADIHKKYDTWKTKTIVRRAKEEEMKRFHKAQTIQRQLTEIEEKFGLLEQKGVELEKAIRGEGGAQSEETSYLIEEWLHLVQTKNALVSEECELTIGARQLELEDQQSRLEQEFRRYINMEDSVKTAFDQKEEERILNEMVEVVDMRNALVNFLDQKRLKEINEQLHGLACADPKNSARCFQVQWS